MHQVNEVNGQTLYEIYKKHRDLRLSLNIMHMTNIYSLP